MKNDAKGAAHESFETVVNRLRMSSKMLRVLVAATLALHLCVFTGWCWLSFTSRELGVVSSWAFARAIHKTAPAIKIPYPNSDKVAKVPARSIATNPEIRQYAESRWNRMKSMALRSCWICLLVPMTVILLKRNSKKFHGKKIIRGVILSTPKKYARILRKHKDDTLFKVGDVAYPASQKHRNLTCIGRPGVGKSLTLKAVSADCIQKGIRGLVYDFKGDFIASFYDPDRDVIFNPADQRCVGFNLFNEIESFTDIDAIAGSLFHCSSDIKDTFWIESAKSIFNVILKYCINFGFCTNGHVWEMLSSNAKTLADNLADLEESASIRHLLEDPSSRMTVSVLATLSQHVKCLELLAPIDGNFSIRDWVRNKKQGVIFISNHPRVRDSLKPLLTLFIDLFARELLSQRDHPQISTYVMIDEAGSLSSGLSSLIDLLKLSRSKAVSIYLGTQDLAQLDASLGRNGRKILLNSCPNRIIYGLGDAETARYCSELLGETEFRTASKSFSFGPKDYRDGSNLQVQVKREPAVLATELMNLPDMEFVAKFGPYPPVKSKIAYKSHENPKHPQPIELRQDLFIMNPTTEIVVEESLPELMETTAQPETEEVKDEK